MPRPATADLEALLRALGAGGVEFIVVGGAAAVIHGAPVTTQDLDIVPRISDDGAARLLGVLTELDARFRPILPGRDLAPTREHLLARGQLNLTTRLGPLDILGRLHDARGFEELFARSQLIIDGDLRVRVINLDALIEIKRGTGRVRDQMVVPLLEALAARSSGPPRDQ